MEERLVLRSQETLESLSKSLYSGVLVGFPCLRRRETSDIQAQRVNSYGTVDTEPDMMMLSSSVIPVH